jgi:hypothetical protein
MATRMGYFKLGYAWLALGFESHGSEKLAGMLSAEEGNWNFFCHAMLVVESIL